RAQFGDDSKTWVHVDATTAEILGHTDRNGRLRRWLFQMLHSWDWLPLLNRRPLWDALLLCLSVGGVMLSITGVVVGYRRLRLKQGVPHRSERRLPRPQLTSRGAPGPGRPERSTRGGGFPNSPL